MTIEEWFANSGSFEAGVFLYSQSKRPNPNLLRLFGRKNQRAESRLRYELKKLLGSTPVTKVAVVPSKQEKAPSISKEALISTSLETENKRVIAAQLPLALREVFYQKNKDYYALYELKLLLNALPANAEEEALRLIVEMKELRLKVDQAWKEIDYFMEHKRELPKTEMDVYTLSPMELVQHRQRRYAQVSKRKKTLAKWEKEVVSIEDLSKKHRKQSRINQQKELIEKLNQEIIALSTHIKKHEKH